jgi:hypothetical protein
MDWMAKLVIILVGIEVRLDTIGKPPIALPNRIGKLENESDPKKI